MARLWHRFGGVSSNDNTPAEGDRRRHERVPVRLLVRYGTSSIDRLAPIADLSEGGLFIQTHEFYPVGTRIQMVIEFRGRSVRHRGKVRWATRAPDHLYDSVVQGMGVQFVDPDPDWGTFFQRIKHTL